MKITYDAQLTVRHSDLGLEIREGAVVLPQALQVLLEKMGARDGAALASILQSFPTAFTTHLGWSSQQLSQATRVALGRLRDAGIAPTPSPLPPSRATGALPPGWLK